MLLKWVINSNVFLPMKPIFKYEILQRLQNLFKNPETLGHSFN